LILARLLALELSGLGKRALVAQWLLKSWLLALGSWLLELLALETWLLKSWLWLLALWLHGSLAKLCSWLACSWSSHSLLALDISLALALYLVLALGSFFRYLLALVLLALANSWLF
jgi:hypothetical protein